MLTVCRGRGRCRRCCRSRCRCGCRCCCRSSCRSCRNKRRYRFYIGYFKVLREDDISRRINQELHRGATFLKGYGAYNRQESDVLLIIAHRSDKVRVTRIIKEIDDTAFVTITKTSSVFGKNFDTLKL